MSQIYDDILRMKSNNNKNMFFPSIFIYKYTINLILKTYI